MLTQMSRLKRLFGLIRNKIDNETAESMCDLASREPQSLDLNPHRGIRSSKEQLVLAAPSKTLGPWLGPPRVPVEHQLGNDPGHGWNHLQEASLSALGWREVWVATAANFS